jgi:hypothetical protein
LKGVFGLFEWIIGFKFHICFLISKNFGEFREEFIYKIYELFFGTILKEFCVNRRKQSIGGI